LRKQEYLGSVWVEGFGSERKGRVPFLFLFGWRWEGEKEGEIVFPSMPSKFLLPTLGGKVRKEKGHEMKSYILNFL
jgi:hypothetical protein